MGSNDLEVSRQLSAALLGHIKIKGLDRLVFEDINIMGSRALKQSTIDRLIHRFELEGCRRYDPLTWITCEIPYLELQRLGQHGTLGEDIVDLQIPETQMLKCLQGQHRIAAALQWLAPNDRWWNFILYDTEKLNEDCRRRLRELDQGSQDFSDGEILQNVRYHQKRGETEPAREWLAKWSPTKCREFKRIFGSKEGKDSSKELANSFDRLLEFPALWGSWYMGTHLPSLRCPDELSNYIGAIYHAWNSFTSDKSVTLDSPTVSLLEGRCPRLSKADRRYIEQLFEEGRLFSHVEEPAMRLKLRASVLGYPKIIPSLKTFFENSKYLKVMTDVMKKLLPPNFKGTIRDAMEKHYYCPEGLQFKVQTSENDFQLHKKPKGYGFWSAYTQLFLFSMRHFYGLTDARPLGRSTSLEKPTFDHSELWKRFKNCAKEIGFTIPGLNTSRPAGSLESIAIYDLLARLRPPELFTYDSSTLSEWSTRIAAMLVEMTPRKVINQTPVHSWDNRETWSLDQRCGMTEVSTFFSDQKYLFMDNIYVDDQDARENMTSFAVKRDIFTTFMPVFGEGDLNMEETLDLGDPSVDPVLDYHPSMLPGGSPVRLNQEHSHPSILPPEDPITNLGESRMSLIPYAINPTSQETESITPFGVNEPSVDRIYIKTQNTKLCTCQTDMSPDVFYSSCKPLFDSNRLPFVVFFNCSTFVADYIRQYDVDIFAQALGDSVWFAGVRDADLSLQTFMADEVHQICTVGKPGLLFHGSGGFHSQFVKHPAQDIKVPTFNPVTSQWVLGV